MYIIAIISSIAVFNNMWPLSAENVASLKYDTS